MTPGDAREYSVDRVPAAWACPGCGESRIDYLVWTRDGDHVDCATCGASYDPNEED